jgi:5'-3' exonuclease
VLLHLVDATFELFRAFYAVPPEKAADGTPVNAVRGILASTISLLRQPEVTHLAGATDQVIESFRNDLFPGYKTGEGIDPDLWAQFPLAEEGLRALGVVVWPMVEFEADDALATAAHRFAAAVDQVVILSPDKDMAQCVRGEHVVTHNRIRKKTYAEADVITKFGVPPASIPDLLALVGDNADGYPGIPGWGMKSAAAVLAVYGHIEDIPRDPGTWRAPVRGAAKLAEALFTRWSEVQLYKYLATVRTDAPLAESLEDLRWRGPSREWQAFCDRWGFRGLAGAVQS